MKITQLMAKSLKAPKWGATSILKPDKALLRLSMIESGWLQPLVVRMSDLTIIDGYHRWMIAQEEEKFIKRHGDWIPIIFHDVDEIDAMVLHIRLNRSRGNVNSYALSKLVKRIVSSGKYNENDLKNVLLMHDDEIDLLMSSGLLKMKNWKQYEYSRAWVPIEVPKGEEVGTSIIERPPNKDR
jgi:hypothetical protein